MWVLSCPVWGQCHNVKRYGEIHRILHKHACHKDHGAVKRQTHDESGHWSVTLPRKGLRTGGQGPRVSQLGEQGQKRIHSTRGQRVLAMLASPLQMQMLT